LPTKPVTASNANDFVVAGYQSNLISTLRRPVRNHPISLLAHRDDTMPNHDTMFQLA
jgi:hypothetical protein